jgi:hypothetical protein
MNQVQHLSGSYSLGVCIPDCCPGSVFITHCAYTLAPSLDKASTTKGVASLSRPQAKRHDTQQSLKLGAGRPPPCRLCSATKDDSRLPVYDVRSMRENTAIASTFVVMQNTFAGIFAVIALVLAATGIYGVMAYRTELRTHEIGIRVALGASRADLMRLVLLQGMRLTAIGLALGHGFFVRADPRHCRSTVRHRRQ